MVSIGAYRKVKKSGKPSFHSEGISWLTLGELQVQTCKKTSDNGLKQEFESKVKMC